MVTTLFLPIYNYVDIFGDTDITGYDMKILRFVWHDLLRPDFGPSHSE